ncbi:deoxyribonuclease IV [Candidatus Babeliales bacterium]|nr:deoxyribonuclease IV [Candidatus Babeliales bacterium]
MKKEKVLLGAHMSIAGGLHNAIIQGEKIGCTAIQIFTKNARSWTKKKLTKKEIYLFKKTLQNSIVKIIISHAAYLINLCSTNENVEKKSIIALAQEIERCEQLAIPYLVLHPGAHKDAGEKEGIKKISKNLDLILKKTKGITMLLLEITAGQGTNIGYTFEQLKSIRSKCKTKKKIGICFDTCHVFAAGYDIRTPDKYKIVMKKFDKIIGTKLLKVIHINDSKGECGCRRDQHANIGKGKIKLKTFQMIMTDKRFKNVPKILETPIQSPTDYINEIILLKKMSQKN